MHGFHGRMLQFESNRYESLSSNAEKVNDLGISDILNFN